MALALKYSEHPRFMDVSREVNRALCSVADKFLCGEALLNPRCEALADQVADDFSALILRAMKIAEAERA